MMETHPDSPDMTNKWYVTGPQVLTNITRSIYLTYFPFEVYFDDGVICFPAQKPFSHLSFYRTG